MASRKRARDSDDAVERMMKKIDRSIAKRGVAKTVSRYNKKQVGAGETKSMDTVLTAAGPVISTTSTNADSIVLNLVQAGTGSWNRIGKKIRCKSIRLYGQATFTYGLFSTTNNLLGSILRMVVVWDKQPSGATIPTFDTIFGSTIQDGTEASTVLNPLRFDNMDRFRVVRDVRIAANPVMLPPTGGTGNLVIDQYPFDEFIKLKVGETVFSGQSAPMTIADVSTGACYVYFRATASNNDLSDWAISANSFARLSYTDL